jgi:thiosulfate/3-mercaptopyruvate sulfurtransferase
VQAVSARARCKLGWAAVLGVALGCAGERGGQSASAAGEPGASGQAASRAAVEVAKLISTDSLAGVIGKGEGRGGEGGGDVTVLDVRTDIGMYLKGHLPGAIYLNTETLRSSVAGVPNLIFPAESYATIFSRLGVRMDRPVVIYSSGESRNIDATYVAWILAGLGHPATYVLDGGIGKWELESRPLTRTYPDVRVSSFKPSASAPERAGLEDVRRALGRSDVLLVDARPPDQFVGQAGAQMRRGHIPGAINHYWQDDLVQRDFARVWKPLDELRASYVSQGITPDKDIIVYCNGGLESSHLYFALRSLLGYPRVRVYDGSWTEWAEREELPIEVGGPAGRRAGGQ